MNPTIGDRVTPENVAALPVGCVVAYDYGDRRLTATKTDPDMWEDADGDPLDDETIADPTESPAIIVSISLGGGLCVKPCPFCGCAHYSLDTGLRAGCKDGEPDAWASSVVCATCAAEGPWRKADTKEEANRRAEAEWNRRVTSPAPSPDTDPKAT